MKRILFVCLGNICRSPMAEFVMKDLVRKAGRGEDFFIASAATSSWELGNPVYPPAREILEAHGIDCTGKQARQLERADYERFDLLIGMDEQNLQDMKAICSGDPEGKIKPLLHWGSSLRQVADPYFTGDFQTTWEDIREGCQGLLKALTE